MHCSHCGICCKKTEMLVSEEDIRLLEKAGCSQKKSIYFTKQGYARLRNRQGYCVFYDPKKHQCNVYRHRPLGCRIYPVIYSEEEGVIIDDLCPESNTVSAKEVEHKTAKLKGLLQKIDNEAKKRKHAIDH
jgi:Fe-S-cluster containining protein